MFSEADSYTRHLNSVFVHALLFFFFLPSVWGSQKGGRRKKILGHRSKNMVNVHIDGDDINDIKNWTVVTCMWKVRRICNPEMKVKFYIVWVKRKDVFKVWSERTNKVESHICLCRIPVPDLWQGYSLSLWQGPIVYLCHFALFITREVLFKHL